MKIKQNIIPTLGLIFLLAIISCTKSVEEEKSSTDIQKETIEHFEKYIKPDLDIYIDKKIEEKVEKLVSVELKKIEEQQVKYQSSFIVDDYILVEGADYYIKKSEVTIGEWKTFLTETNSDKSIMSYLKVDPVDDRFYANNDNLPVFRVTWYEALEYCNWLSKINNLEPVYNIKEIKGFTTVEWFESANGYRLPTEEEWQNAALGGKNSMKYLYAGSDAIDDIAFYNQNSDNQPHEVMLKEPNELGLYDMSGNVMEWCWDTYDKESKVIKGGSFITDITLCEIKTSIGFEPYDKHFLVGLRPVRNAE